MEKKNVSLAVLLALLLTLTVGYALFSQTINITGSAKAQGNFIINGYCYVGLPNNIATKLGAANIETEGGYRNDTCSPANNAAGTTISMSVNFDYPTAKRYFVAKIANEGSIDAMMDMENDFSGDGLACFDMNEDGSLDERNHAENDSGECVTTEGFDTNAAANYGIIGILFEKANETIVDENDQDYVEFLDENTGNIVLKPNEKMYVVFLSQFDEGVNGTNPDGSFIYKSINNLSFTFHQPTAQ